MKKTFSKETRLLALRSSNGTCECEADVSNQCSKQATQFHHGLPNTKVNQKLFPLFLHSIFNCFPINHDCHMTKPLPGIRPHVASACDTWLRRFKEGEE